jgi:hypothetical protein
VVSTKEGDLRGTRLIAACVAMLAVGAALAGPASASKKCPDGWFCMWTGKHYTGTKFKYREPGVLVVLPKSMNNKVSSAKNRWIDYAYLYGTKDGGGFSYGYASGVKDPVLHPPFDNRASSAYLSAP